MDFGVQTLIGGPVLRPDPLWWDWGLRHSTESLR